MITEFNINSNLGKDAKLLQIKEYIDVNKIKNKNYKVLDVGGGVRNKADIQIDALFDLNDDVMNDENKGIRVIKKDFCEKDAWQTIDDKSFDFTICTHTLDCFLPPHTEYLEAIEELLSYEDSK